VGEGSFVTAAEIVAAICFGLAILHTFLVKAFHKIAQRFADGSAGENFFHLLGEVEIVFGLWAAIFILSLAFIKGSHSAIEYLQERDFTEALFVFVIMVVCATSPILRLAGQLIRSLAAILPLKDSLAFYLVALVIGPALGSFITEPAAMTLTALILLDRFYAKKISPELKYATIGLLFVNISIGGTLTPFAAPPILMVAPQWNWDLTFMLSNFGWKGVLSSMISTSLILFRFRKEIGEMKWDQNHGEAHTRIPPWVVVTHLIFLALIVLSSHHMVIFVGVFLFFLGLTTVTKEYQSELKIREGLLVAFFLAGLVVLGGFQRWWLEPILSKLDALSLYLSAIGLTAITDNAALTYLGAQVPTISETAKYSLVAGAVVGGGLTVIANAPNPAGYGILNDSFGKEGISPLGLFKAALLPTAISGLIFWFA
jgi:hypothetical protein